jgi:diguanylate cyclase (GGDEF)-like protein
MTQRIADTRVRRTRTLDRIGLAGRPRSVRVLTGVVIGAALVAATLGILLPGHPVAEDPLSAVVGVAVATILVAAGQFARLRFRLGRGTVSVSWGEAAFILGFALAPPGWLPVATLVGAGGAWLLVSWLNDHRPPVEIVHLAASLSLGAAGAAVVASAVVGDASLATARAQIGLVAGALTYLLITFGLAGLTLALHHDATPRQIVARVLYAKVPMFVGNVLVGLCGLFVLTRAPLWLLAFPPALWLLQRTYRYHLRAEEERRTWEDFARATGALPGAVEAEVAAAGLRGALDVFGARRVEIEVLRPDGFHRRYVEDAPGPDVEASGLLGPVITRTMAVADAPVGELTVWLAEPTLPAARDELAVSAYGDALAGALHDAAARERLVELEARVAHDATHDPLTGLLNRAALLSEGDRALRSFDRDHHVALLLLDLNDFREVNGTLGHQAGDAVLGMVAERMVDLSRQDELVARLGDDEFALLLPTIATLTDSAAMVYEPPSPLPRALRRARELVDQLATPMEISGVRLAIESAIGVVVAKAGDIDLAELVRRATLALEQAKELRLSVATYDSARDASSTDHLAMLAELQDALATRDQLVLALQPAVDLETSAPVGVEALTRWRHPRRGQLPPAEFIKTIEGSELLTPFTRYILDLSLKAAADWATEGIDVPVSVNVSARSLLDATFPAQIGDLLRRHRQPARRLVLEITESVAVSDQEIVDEVLAALREMGVQISVDDFGTGFSSLSFVTRVPVDELKVDRSFVDEMIDSTAAEAVVRGAIELGARLGARVVAEGVETAEQRAALLALGCTTAQGYHFCRPLPADKIVGALRQLADAAPSKIVPLRADDAS